MFFTLVYYCLVVVFVIHCLSIVIHFTYKKKNVLLSLLLTNQSLLFVNCNQYIIDFEDLEETPVLPGYGELPKTSYPVNAEDGRVTLSEKHFVELQKTIQKLNLEVNGILIL